MSQKQKTPKSARKSTLPEEDQDAPGLTKDKFMDMWFPKSKEANLDSEEQEEEQLLPSQGPDFQPQNAKDLTQTPSKKASQETSSQSERRKSTSETPSKKKQASQDLLASSQSEKQKSTSSSERAKPTVEVEEAPVGETTPKKKKATSKKSKEGKSKKDDKKSEKSTPKKKKSDEKKRKASDTEEAETEQPPKKKVKVVHTSNQDLETFVLMSNVMERSLLPRAPFARVVRDVMREVTPEQLGPLRMSQNALEILREVTEYELTNTMFMASVLAGVRGRTTLSVGDYRLASLLNGMHGERLHLHTNVSQLEPVYKAYGIDYKKNVRFDQMLAGRSLAQLEKHISFKHKKKPRNKKSKDDDEDHNEETPKKKKAKVSKIEKKKSKKVAKADDDEEPETEPENEETEL